VKTVKYLVFQVKNVIEFYIFKLIFVEKIEISFSTRTTETGQQLSM